MAVLGNDEVVFREFEAGQCINTTRNDLPDAPRCKCMTQNSVFGKRCCQCDRTIEIGIPAAFEVLLRLCFVAIVQREFSQMKVNFAQPCWMRCFVWVPQTPTEFLLGSLALVKEAGKLRMHDTGDPVDDENLTA